MDPGQAGRAFRRPGAGATKSHSSELPLESGKRPRHRIPLARLRIMGPRATRTPSVCRATMCWSRSGNDSEEGFAWLGWQPSSNRRGRSESAGESSVGGWAWGAFCPFSARRFAVPYLEGTSAREANVLARLAIVALAALWVTALSAASEGLTSCITPTVSPSFLAGRAQA
jgi:hypothetical protein